LYFRIAGILPAVFIIIFLLHVSRCHQVADPGHAVRREMVAFHGVPSYRIAGILPAVFIIIFLLHVSRCHQGWWRSMASPLIGSLASCRHLL
jgi:hypothetical protein